MVKQITSMAKSCSAARQTLGALLVLGAVAAASSPAQAYVYTSCARFGSWTDGYYTIYNDVWGNHKQNTQCLYVNSAGSWNVTSTQSGSGVKSYPDTSLSIAATPISSMTTISASFNGTAPTDSAESWDFAFDLWSAGSADEIMIWEDWTGAVGPIANSYTCNGACPIFTNVSIGGSTWNVYQGNTGHNVVSFLRTTKRDSGTEDCLAILKFCQANNLLVSNTIQQVQFGWEITSTGGVQRTFTMNSYSTTVN